MKIFLPFLVICIGIIKSYGQCDAGTDGFISGAINPTTAGVANEVTHPQGYAGDYYLISVTNGNTYVFRTCFTENASIDTKLTLYNSTNLNAGQHLAYNDNFCGNQSQITWTATFTGTVRLSLYHTVCNVAVTTATKIGCYFTTPTTSTTTWNGTTWSNGNPSSTIDAIINSSTAPSNFTCKALTINNGVALTTTGITATINGNITNNGNGIAGTGTVAINANSTLGGTAITIAGILNLVSGTLTTASLLRISPTGKITGSYTNISGNTTLQQSIIAQRGWRVLANPFNAAQTLSTIATNNSITINTNASNSPVNITDARTFSNSSNAWSNAGTTIAANQAYALFIRGLSSQVIGTSYSSGPSAFTYNVTGILNGNTVSFTPSSSSNYLVIGNPYAAPVNTQALTGGSSRAYQTYQITQGGNTTAQRTKAGAWVPAASNSNTTTTIPILGALAYIPANTNVFNVSNTDINTSGTAATNLFNTNNNSITQLGISLEQEEQLLDRIYCREEKNNNQSLPKFKNDIANLYIKASNNQVLSIESKNQLQGKEQLGLIAAKGNYTFTVNENSLPQKTKAILIDKYQQTETVLTTNITYHFQVTNDTASQGENRFEIVFNPTNTSTVIAETLNHNRVFAVKLLHNVGSANIAIQMQHAFNNQAIATVTDVQGKVISSKAIVSGNDNIVMPEVKGMYLVIITDGIHKVVEKVIR
jgi:hypothetical protein